MAIFVALYVLEAVHHSAAKLEENGPLAKPAPPLKGTGRHFPPFRELTLINVYQRHTPTPHCIAYAICAPEIVSGRMPRRYRRAKKKV